MFVDEAFIKVKSGNGGDGAISFRREKFIDSGGPDGGDGGKGGDIVFRVDNNLNTLMEFNNRKSFTAPNGSNGLSKKRNGRSGDSLIILVPAGTLVRDSETNTLLLDLKEEGEQLFLVGGDGGAGNTRFKSSLNRAPRMATRGKKGKEIRLKLELKLLSDVAIMGFPNAGKSTLLNTLSNAKSKVANYPFSTLQPKLGIVNYKGSYIKLSDIPGLIEGASSGKGLGFQFLKHIERSKILWHLVDLSATNLVANFKNLNRELEQYSSKLSKKMQIVVGTKRDAIIEGKESREFEQFLISEKYNYIFISSAASINLKELLDLTSKHLDEYREEEEDLELIARVESLNNEHLEENFTVEKLSEKSYKVRGQIVDRVKEKYLFLEDEGPSIFIKILRNLGMENKLIEAGIKEGDEVHILDMAFEFKL